VIQSLIFLARLLVLILFAMWLCVSYSETDLFHPKRESTVEKGLTLGTVERDHIRDLHPIMAQGAGVRLQRGARTEAEVLTMKSTLGNQLEIGLLVSDPLETDHSYASFLLDLVCTLCQSCLFLFCSVSWIWSRFCFCYDILEYVYWLHVVEDLESVMYFERGMFKTMVDRNWLELLMCCFMSI